MNIFVSILAERKIDWLLFLVEFSHFCEMIRMLVQLVDVNTFERREKLKE
jgi:hypothetical protein